MMAEFASSFLEFDIGCSLNMYKHKDIPLGTIHIKDLEKIGKDRIKLYRILDKLQLETLSLEQFTEVLEHQLPQNSLVNYSRILKKNSNRHDRLEDNIGHWLMSLLYCKNELLTAMFVKFELQWFHVRYQQLDIDQREKFLEKNGYNYEEACVLKPLIYYDEFSGCIGGANPMGMKWLETRFENVRCLIATRKVYLERGKAYFNADDLIHQIKYNFGHQLRMQLHFNRKVDINDERISDLLRSFHIVSLHRFDKNVSSVVNVNNIDEIAKKHFPPCMRAIHNLLRQNHHLKYGCKMQYGLFLKDIGMPYDDALEFWENEFTKSMPLEKYNKKYVYLFKHQYGQVGGRLDRSSYSCDHIIEEDPLPLQYHGCPFKHWNMDNLRKVLDHPRCDIADIEDLVGKGLYRQACTKCFTSERNIKELDPISTPVQYTLTSLQSTGKAHQSDV